MVLLTCLIAFYPPHEIFAEDTVSANKIEETTDAADRSLDIESIMKSNIDEVPEEEKDNASEPSELETEASESNQKTAESNTDVVEEEQDSENTESEQWFQITLKDILFQLLGGILLICLPGCYIYWKAKY